jgi:hypothetical protein
MADELLGHLADAFDYERRGAGDESAAFEAALCRLGDVEELQRQLQNSVPFIERIFFAGLGQEEFSMTRLLLWIVALIALGIGVNTVFGGFGPFINISAVLVAAAVVLVRVSRKDPTFVRYFGPRVMVLVGILGVLFGTALILPALARYRQLGGVMSLASGAALTGGALLVLEAFAFIACAIAARRTHAA